MGKSSFVAQVVLNSWLKVICGLPSKQAHTTSSSLFIIYKHLIHLIFSTSGGYVTKYEELIKNILQI